MMEDTLAREQPFVESESNKTNASNDQGCKNLAGAPWICVSSPGQSDHYGCDRSHEQHDSEVVNLCEQVV